MTIVKIISLAFFPFADRGHGSKKTIAIGNEAVSCNIMYNSYRHKYVKQSFENIENYVLRKHDAYDDKITGIKGRLSKAEKAVTLDAVTESYGKDGGDIDYFLNRNYKKTLKNYNNISRNLDMIDRNYCQLLSSQFLIEDLTKQVEALTAKVEALEA